MFPLPWHWSGPVRAPAPVAPRRRLGLRDPDDERILEVAVQCRAMIITHNTKDFVGAEQFGVVVKTPAEFLKMSREHQ